MPPDRTHISKHYCSLCFERCFVNNNRSDRPPKTSEFWMQPGQVNCRTRYHSQVIFPAKPCLEVLNICLLSITQYMYSHTQRVLGFWFWFCRKHESGSRVGGQFELQIVCTLDRLLTVSAMSKHGQGQSIVVKLKRFRATALLSHSQRSNLQRTWRSFFGDLLNTRLAFGLFTLYTLQII